MNEPIVPFKSRLVPMNVPNVDTDQIIPARFLTVRSPEEFAHALFRTQRENDSNHVLSRPEMLGRSVLVAGPNFGCGSSREHAVWALVHGGFRAVIATSFGDVFYNNALKNGLLPIRVTDAQHATLIAALQRDPDLELTIDLPSERVSSADGAVDAPIEIDHFYRELLMSGKDELDHLISLVDDAERYERSNRAHPTTRSRLASGTIAKQQATSDQRSRS
jgi:3-isopropylmalate/(R)-2-methylmalate dehydratase small subunit